MTDSLDAAAPFVDADWLREHLTGSTSDASSPRVVVCHVGTSMGGIDPRSAFAERHVPGARFVSLDDDLADHPGPVVGRHPLPTPERFAAVLGSLGVAPTDHVVAVDGRGGGFAARLVWMARIIGQRASLLADGWRGPWESSLPTSDTDTQASADSTFEPVERHPIPWPPDALADADEVAATVRLGGTVVDSRAPERHRGEVEPLDAVAGHIPGSINLPFDDDDPRRFDHFDTGRPIIVLCGSGVTACFNALAMEAAGLSRPKVYVGSWSGWSTDPDRPIAVGSD